MGIELSVVSPVYGASTLLVELVQRIEEKVSLITASYELILVEDNSPDNSWEIMTAIAKANPKVIAVKLSRNFGQQNAINAGLDIASGEWVVTMDCDLQDDPHYISDLYNKGLSGYDIVFASRSERKDSWLKKTGSYLFYKLLGYLSETEQDHTIANYIIYHRKVINAMASMGDYFRYYPMINKWVGFKTIKLAIPHAERMDNKESSYSFKKRSRLALNTILAFSDKPLRIVLKLGFYFVLFSFFGAVYLVTNYVINGVTVSGWLSIFVSVWFLFGIMMMILGLIGLYLGKAFETLKGRPTYIIQDRIN